MNAQFPSVDAYYPPELETVRSTGFVGVSPIAQHDSFLISAFSPRTSFAICSSAGLCVTTGCIFCRVRPVAGGQKGEMICWCLALRASGCDDEALEQGERFRSL